LKQKNPQHVYIGFLYVTPIFRIQKISTLILGSLRDWALEKELKALRLNTYNNNIRSSESL